VPVLIGPYTYNFTQAAEAAVASGAAVRVDDAGSAVRQARSLLQDPARRERMGGAGMRFCAQHQGATARTLALVEGVIRT
jgi:3-deoxy-D-manno-octulosonic-acid transferase